jgi:NADPH-dependent glutamate synthase beta subunit-like oxidoreductase
MPVYIYETEGTDEIVELFFNSYKEKDENEFIHDNGRKAILLDSGKTAFRCVGHERRGVKTFTKNWPLYSDAMGCNPDQANEAYEESVKMGVPTRFNVPGQEGRAEFLSASHRKEYCKKMGFHDRNAGYSDPTP